jgi:LysR family transcriptional regulator, regulator for metE and metH
MERIDELAAPILEVRDLRVALALAAERTTAKAAEVLHITQPAVSRALCSLEDKLGTALFERTSRGLVATAAGERFLAGAGRLVAELCELEHQVRRQTSGPTRVRLVCECYTAYHWLPSALVSMRRSLPDLEVALAVEHTTSPVQAMEANQVDVALLTTAPVPRARLVERPLFSDEIVFVMAASHPLAARRVLHPADLCEHKLLTSRTPPAENSWFLKQVFGRARPRLTYELFPLTEAIIDVARAGMGIAVLSEWIAGPHLGRGDLVAKRISSGPLRRPWRLAWRPEVEDAAIRLFNALTANAPRTRLAA